MTPWENQDHPNPDFVHPGNLNPNNEFAVCLNRNYTVNLPLKDPSHRIDWYQGEQKVDNNQTSITFTPLLPGHGGFYIGMEMDREDNMSREIVFTVLGVDCEDVNMEQVPTGLCRGTHRENALVVDDGSNKRIRFPIKDQMAEGTPIRYFKECKTPLPDLDDLEIVTESQLEGLGMFVALWEDKNGKVKVSSVMIKEAPSE